MTKTMERVVKLSDVKGIGAKKLKLLENLHICNLKDALEAYPRTYEDRTNIVPIAEVHNNEMNAIRATVAGTPFLGATKSNVPMVKCKVRDQSGVITVLFFNNPYARSYLQYGKEYLFYGMVKDNGYGATLISPAYEEIPDNGDIKPCIAPVYHLTAGIKQLDMKRVTDAALETLAEDCEDPMPKDVLERHQLLNLHDALIAIHRPESMDDIEKARKRLTFEELFYMSCGLQQLKGMRQTHKGEIFSHSSLDEFFSVLKFAPTNAQKRAIYDIVKDCVSGRPMNRLVQGDVGSGKTVVAAAMCVMAAKSGFQAAFMAPTEILAQQHMENLSPLFDKLGITSTLLTSSMPIAQKKEALKAIKSGKTQVAIGTHSLIQSGVEFYRLGAVVADEQHRFGVKQRADLSSKGNMPHVLVMSATPIPRTLSLIMYGDLDVSVLDELPPGRSPVKTYFVGEKMRQRITKFIDKQIEEGGQVYVVCPLIEEGCVDCKDVEQHAKELQKELPSRNVAVIHGRIKNEEKDQIMQDFKNKKYDVLVATTVIEVGVDVPNANLIVVEDAWRFGLSQLHQLRGRVGRGSRQSYCILFGADRANTERLRVMCKTTDGFVIAQEDLKLRGPGDFFGERQHGLPQLKVANIVTDMAMMQIVNEEAEELLKNDPKLMLYPKLEQRISELFKKQGDVLN